MGLFDFIKKNNHSQSFKMDNFEIGELSPKLIYTENYSQNISIILFLRTVKFIDSEINEVLSSKNPCTSIQNVITRKNEYQDLKYKQHQANIVIIQYKTIIKDYSNFINIFTNIIYNNIDFNFGISIIEKKDYSYDYYKKELIQFKKNIDDYSTYPIILSKELLGCIILYKIRKNISYQLIFQEIIDNINNLGATEKFIINKYIPNELIYRIVYNNICSIDRKSFSLSYLLKKEDKIDTSNIDDSVFNIELLEQYEYDPKFYYISNTDYQKKCKNDLNKLNFYIDQASKILNFNMSKININHLFFNKNRKGYITLIEYIPITRTGKASKFPYGYSFQSNGPAKEVYENYNLEVVGKVYMFKNGEIGKAEFTTWTNRIAYTIKLSIYNNKLIIASIRHIVPDTGERIIIYDYRDNIKSIE